MSTSLLYHGLGIRGYQHQATHFGQGRILLEIRQRRDDLRCGHCGSARVIRRGQVQRQFRALPLGARPVVLQLAIARVECGDCGCLGQVKVAFADERRGYTRSFARYATELCRRMTIQDVADHLGVGWDLIKDLHKEYLCRRHRKPKLKKLRQIAIDEISIGKGARYLTVVLDLVTGAVVFVGRGRDAACLEPFWRRLKRCRARIEAVATDMSPAYILAVSDNLPNATHVFDRFHVVKLFNEKLSDLRRQLYTVADTIEQKKVLKGTRWLLLKNQENLDDTRNERHCLEEALRLNQPLATAYYMKEDLGELWAQPSKRHAARFLDDWVARAHASGVRMLKKFANTLQLHRKGLLAWYDFPISTGALEGTNNKIKTLQRQAYGFRDEDYFTWRIYGLHETKYALVG
jgi:transposase